MIITKQRLNIVHEIHISIVIKTIGKTIKMSLN